MGGVVTAHSSTSTSSERGGERRSVRQDLKGPELQLVALLMPLVRCFPVPLHLLTNWATHENCLLLPMSAVLGQFKLRG